MNNKEIFSSNLKYYMDVNGESRKEFADAIAVSYFTATDWINGKKFPRMDNVEKIAAHYGVKISDLIEKKTIEKNPVEMAERHVEILMDEDFIALYADFKNLDKKKRKIVKDLVQSLSDVEA